MLHGVTASGKTEIYIHLIQQAIQAGKQVLYLLPEIALTTQITERLKRVFGNRLGIYHSKFPDAERVEIWRKQLTDDDYDVILGVRSSVFLPFRRLGLVIVDEEHENTYNSRIRLHVIMRAMQLSYWHRCSEQRHCWVRLHLVSKPIIMLFMENMAGYSLPNDIRMFCFLILSGRYQGTCPKEADDGSVFSTLASENP